ncbi:MAG: ABC transporter permease, partial [Henriciella sp.]
MMETSILSLAAASLRNRLGSATLTILAVALSVTLFLGVEKSRTAMRTSFDNTISGTELIVGAPTGATNLLLHAVFHIGTPQAELSWSRYQEIAARPDIAWAAPVILGDSHRGFDVLATNQTYFDHYKFGRDRSLELASGEIMTDIFDAVVGASVAAELGYDIGTPLILSHGIESTGHAHHDDRPFRIVGILKPTGTPVDRTVHIGLEGLTAMHVGWETGSRHHLAHSITTEMIRSFDLTPDSVSAVFIGLKDKTTILQTRRALNSQREEPVT